jgi:hypothetical protein
MIKKGRMVAEACGEFFWNLLQKEEQKEAIETEL